MKLIIQIPCLNEEETLPAVIRDLPEALPGIDEIEYLVVDDGSIDRTAETAESLGVHHVLRLPRKQGLACAFREGLRYAVHCGADIVVNTDGDNQYCGEDVEKLVAPIIRGEAEMVIGCRDIWNHPEFSLLKRLLQRIGSMVVAWMASIQVPDATSGFRAYSRDTALRLTVFSSFSYTLETLIQACAKRICVRHVPIRVNPKTRESRLFRGMQQYITKSIMTMLRVFTTYRPFKAFMLLGSTLMMMAFAIGVRFLYYFFTTPESGKTQSLILAAIFALLGGNCILMGLLADANATTRLICEELLYAERKRICARESSAGKDNS